MAKPLISLFISALIGMLSLSAWAESKTITYTNTQGPVLSRTVTPTGAKPGHELIQQVRQDMTSSSDPDWDGAVLINFSQSDLTAGSGTVSGYGIRTHRNGDQTYVRYQGKTIATGEGASRQVTGEGTLEIIGGTGKFAKAKGSGTWSFAKGQSIIKLNLDH